MMENKYMECEDMQFMLEFISKHNWAFAKTMPQNPHYYVVRKNCVDEEFVRFVQLIRKYGFRMKYGKSWYVCFRVNEWFYWTMGWPILERHEKNATIIINRKECRLAAENPYDDLSREYDGYFDDEFSLDEDVQVADLISRHNTGGKTLEIGCGSGMVTRNLMFDKEQYVGIDPSHNMLEQFRATEQLAELKTINTDFESFVAFEKFKFVFATYGAASYVRPEFWNRLNDILERGGTFLLMFYADDYTPATHIYSSTEMPYYSAAEFMANCDINVKKSRVGNYVVLEGVKK